MVKVRCQKSGSGRIAAMVVAFFMLLVSLPSRDGQLISHSVTLSPFSNNPQTTIALEPNDQSAQADHYFLRAQRAARQSHWEEAQNECEKSLSLAETFRYEQASEIQRNHYQKQFQRIHEFYLELLLRPDAGQSAVTETAAAHAWEAHERGHWWQWQQPLRALQEQPSQKTASSGVIPLRQAGALLAAVRERLLDDQTELLEYALGEQHSYLWRISRTQIRIHELPSRSRIKQAVQQLRTELATPANQTWQSKTLLQLRAWLLPHLDASSFEGRWLIVTEEALQGVPFTLLTTQSTPPIVTEIPSAFLALKENENEVNFLTAKVAVLADPVFGQHDERLDSIRPSQTSQLRSATHIAPLFMPRLPFARREGENLAQHFLPAAALRAFDFAASRKLVMSGRLSDYPIIHFATHGVENPNQPESYGLLLSQVNERGERQPGLLQVRDICRMQFPAELIVLSACDSNRLAASFLFAGARRVLSTRWPVDDAATSELMAHFYDALLGSNGVAPSAALRQAQLALAREPRWQHPHYWAGFALQGEW